MRAKIRLTVIKHSEMPWVKSPTVVTAPDGRKRELAELAIGDPGGREYMSLGIDSNPREATRKAVRGVVDWLVSYKGLERSDAYMLCSVAASLKMCEVVDMPNYGEFCFCSVSSKPLVFRTPRFRHRFADAGHHSYRMLDTSWYLCQEE